MSTHLTEEEQVEALKQWWKDNGLSVIGGAVIGLAGVFGWRWWGDHQAALAGQASAQYDALHQAVRAKSPEAQQLADKLSAEHRNNVYATFAALDLAKLRVEADDLQGARAHLETALANAPSAPLKELARLRLARLLVDLKDLNGATRLIGEAGQGAFAGDYAELRGDIARARNDLAGARQAYQEALAKNPTMMEIIQMKLDDLGGSDA